MIRFARNPACSIAALAVAVALFPAGPAAGAGKRPVVVELFTSQGCYSCPPADRFLGVLAQRPGVLALSFHVDYWNYLGWRDPFSSPEATQRQRRYAAAMRRRSVYTPQMVVDGTLQDIGSRTAAIEALIRTRQAAADRGVAVSIAEGGEPGSLAVTVAGGRSADAAVWLVRFDTRHTTAIPRGENAGKTLTYHNVVREIRRVADYRGAPLRLAVARPDGAAARRDRAAIIVQEPAGGRILGAAWTALK